MRCEEKAAYPSQRRAMEHARKRQRQNPTLELRAYRCNICGRWHLTHLPDRYEREAS